MPSDYLDELRPIPGFEHAYSITRDGRVWSHIKKRVGWIRGYIGDDHGLRYNLALQGKRVKASVTVLVSRAFPGEDIGMTRSQPLSYEFIRVRQGDGLVTKARGFCVCGAKEEITWNSTNNPEAIKHAFEAHGWEFDPWRRGRCLCPTCVNARRARRTNTNELIEKKGVTMIGERVTAAVVPTVASDKAVADVREPTISEMRKIISMLEGKFDDVARIYIKGWTDRRVAEELQLPMAMITKVRREAFGELKVADDIQELRDDFNKLLQQMSDFEARLNAITAKVA